MQIKIKPSGIISGELVRIFCFSMSTEVSQRAGAAIRAVDTGLVWKCAPSRSICIKH